MELVNTSTPEKPTDCTINGECSQCGGCCPSMLPVTENELSELRELAQNVKPHAIKPTPDTITVDFTCPFLENAPDDGKSRCSIYDDRPLICRKFTCQVFGRMTNEQLSKMPDMSDEEVRRIAMAKHHNLWNLFNKTGFVINGEEMSLEDAPVITLCMDDGSERKATVGTYVELPDIAGDIVKGLLAGADSNGIRILTPYREIITIPC